MMIQKNVQHVAQHVKYAGQKEKKMSEPELDDDYALGKDDTCADCDEHMSQCICTEPDRMYGDED